MKTTQETMILSYLKEYGSITPMDALREFQCFRLASRISDLKRKGHDIRKTMVKTVNAWTGDATYYASYYLAP